jgi:hypothetical protein
MRHEDAEPQVVLVTGVKKTVAAHGSIIPWSTNLSKISPPATPLRAIAVSIILNLQQKVTRLYPHWGVVLPSID